MGDYILDYTRCLMGAVNVSSIKLLQTRILVEQIPISLPLIYNRNHMFAFKNEVQTSAIAAKLIKHRRVVSWNFS